MLAVTPSAYDQLDDEAMALLRQGLAQAGSITALSVRLGYSRPALSAALAGKYKGHTTRLRARLFEVLHGGVACPHLGGETIPAGQCAELRARPLSTSNRDALKQWQACRICPHGGQCSED